MGIRDGVLVWQPPSWISGMMMISSPSFSSSGETANIEGEEIQNEKAVAKSVNNSFRDVFFMISCVYYSGKGRAKDAANKIFDEGKNYNLESEIGL